MMKKILFFLVAAFLFGGCGGGDGEQGDWQSALKEVEGGQSLFTFLFGAQEVSGISVKGMLFSFESENPCLYLASEGGQASGPGSFSMVMFDLNRAETGQFEVVPSLDDDDWEDPGLLAKVVFLKVEDWKPGLQCEAVEGTIDVRSVPASVADWNGGTLTEATISVEFPVRFMRSTECEWATGEDGETISVCTCVDDEGNTSECENEEGSEDDCCRWASDDRVAFEATFTAGQCKELCATAASGSDLPYGCGDLN